jgi:transglutaminase-like putative cysteine protease
LREKLAARLTLAAAESGNMLIKIGFDIELAVATPMALIYLLRVHPSRRDDLVAPEDLRISGELQPEEYVDTFGNHCGRVNVPVGMGTVRITNQAVVRDSGLLDDEDFNARQHDPTELPASTLQVLLPSRYCEVDSELLGFAWNQFGNTPPGMARVRAITTFVNQHIKFNYKTARPTRTALDTFREREGVCRDFTHLAVTLCRCMNIPARYTTGYLGDIGVPYAGAGDFSAWFEVFLGERWYTADARHNARRIGRIVMARGRDAGDVPITMCFGPSSLLRFEVVTDEVIEPSSTLAAAA